MAQVGGALALHADPPGHTIRLAALQPNIQIGEQDTQEGRHAAFTRLERLTFTAAAQRPSLIAWPETAIAGNLQADPLLAADLQVSGPRSWNADRTGCFGGRKVCLTRRLGNITPAGLQFRLSRLPRRTAPSTLPQTAPVAVRRICPAGNDGPLAGMDGREGFDSEPGQASRLFSLPDGSPFAVMICWESLFSDLSRESVQAGARLLVQLNNPAWFGQTAAAKQQNISSVFRAVENRVPVLLASNTGPSQIIDSYGRSSRRAPPSSLPAWWLADVVLGSSGTLYTRIGDGFVWCLSGVSLLLGLVQVRRTSVAPPVSRRRPSSPEAPAVS